MMLFLRRAPASLQRFFRQFIDDPEVFSQRISAMFSQFKPIAICQHDASQGPAYLQCYLENDQLPYQIFAVHQGDAPPLSSKDFSAVVLLGSNASVNDPYLWIKQEETLVQDALTRHRPLLSYQHLKSVQSEAQILQNLPAKVAALHQAANDTYHQWLQQVPDFLRCLAGAAGWR